MDIEDKIKEIISVELGIDKDSISPEQHLRNDLGADSLETVDMVLGIEDTFGIEITDDELDSFKKMTIGEIISVITRKVEFDMVRAKFTCSRNEKQGESMRLEFTPVFTGSEENKNFFKWTPGGKIELQVVNPEAAEKFELGKEYFVDFTPA